MEGCSADDTVENGRNGRPQVCDDDLGARADCGCRNSRAERAHVLGTSANHAPWGRACSRSAVRRRCRSRRQDNSCLGAAGGKNFFSPTDLRLRQRWYSEEFH